MGEIDDGTAHKLAEQLRLLLARSSRLQKSHHKARESRSA
jgi:hypothetical protein